MKDQTPSPRRSRGRPKNAFSDGQSSTIQALDRGLSVLSALARDGGGTLSDVSMRLGMPASTAHRVLATLEKHGYVDMDEASQTWRVGLEAFRVGTSFMQRTNLLEVGRASMRTLMEQTGETANLGILDNDHVVFIGQVETHNPIRAFHRPGSSGPMHASGIGKALLAAMPQGAVENLFRRTGLQQFSPKTLTDPEALLSDLRITRKRGWSFDNEERYEGMCCVAAVIYDSFREPIAGISVSGPSARFAPGALPALGAAVQTAARDVTAQIGGEMPQIAAE
ncbi:transcriptional regulator [Dinoroseobacter shibae DFL 12 = DSM 16493]|jgi:IclR family acetate operon transcriptional repressor|uniref:Transcriptional regulator n=1 Tax=Dinoroseobacter shibae (strain DSM 16493 / NCIMB 14021 / DFL 12) TaxID=398580 RepID=A8LRI1_DINSH|nr:HTH-type transcriptional regulator BhcR [Dinoroseobacter shibae]ABV92631.1 transcriptional regulator [Dinoroseobacter shibae DFL 12 = DSM 16493]URF47569.1 IclR family transcriptional regulator [Dinoroseobacter shibae]URF51879.1 IclR family transcriptional regulator [Dinoroseobacter shibae]